MHLSIIPHDTVEAQNEYFYFYKKHIAKKKKMKQSKISIKKNINSLILSTSNRKSCIWLSFVK